MRSVMHGHLWSPLIWSHVYDTVMFGGLFRHFLWMHFGLHSALYICIIFMWLVRVIMILWYIYIVDASCITRGLSSFFVESIGTTLWYTWLICCILCVIPLHFYKFSSCLFLHGNFIGSYIKSNWKLEGTLLTAQSYGSPWIHFLSLSNMKVRGA